MMKVSNTDCKADPMRDLIMDWMLMYWIDTVTQAPHNRYEEYPDCIQDGVTLCKLMNVLHPGSIDSLEGRGSNCATSRLKLFQRAASDYGIPEADMFQPKDLLEKQNIPAVSNCILMLTKLAQEHGFQSPDLDTILPKVCHSRFYCHMPHIFH